MCVQTISITDGFEIAKSKTVVKLEVDDVVEIVGAQQTLPNGVARIECRTVETNKQGWVTMKGNQGTTYLELFSPYNAFVKQTDKNIDAVIKVGNKAAGFIKTKTQALQNTPAGPLADARQALTALRPQITAAQQKLDTLKKSVVESKAGYIRKQEQV